MTRGLGPKTIQPFWPKGEQISKFDQLFTSLCLHFPFRWADLLHFQHVHMNHKSQTYQKIEIAY